MKAITLLLSGLVLFLAAIFVPRGLDPTNTAIVWIRLLRVPAIICIIIGFIRLVREKKS
jgi:hypothetical protein